MSLPGLPNNVSQTRWFKQQKCLLVKSEIKRSAELVLSEGCHGHICSRHHSLAYRMAIILLGIITLSIFYVCLSLCSDFPFL